MALQGSLRTMPLPELLMWISQFQKSGTLRVVVDETTRELGFERGSLTFSSSSEPGGTLGRLLIDKRVITEEMHEQARELRMDRSVAVAKGLCQLGFIPEEDILRYLRKKAEMELFDLFRKLDGEFSFDEEDERGLDLLPLRVNVASLVLRITQQMDENDEYDFDQSGIRIQIPPEI